MQIGRINPFVTLVYLRVPRFITEIIVSYPTIEALDCQRNKNNSVSIATNETSQLI